MKILIVTRSFYPENSPRSHRATELAKEFAQQGHAVTVLTPSIPYIHDTFGRQHNLALKDLGALHWKSPDYGSTKVGKLFSRVFRRLLSLVFEYPDIELLFRIKHALARETGYDLLVSIAVPYPVHWGVAVSVSRHPSVAKTWVADCGDPYMGCTTDSFKKLFYFKYVEKSFMKQADYITIPVESARGAYYDEFHHKIKVIPQGFRFQSALASGTIPCNAVPTFAYAGGFIPKIRDPRPFLELLTKIPADFRFIIYTNSPDLIDAYKSRLGEKLQICPYIPREELLSILSGMDFLVNFDNNTETAQPSKLIDYAIAGRPILNVTKTTDSQLIHQFLTGNYNNALTIENIDQYRIENVCDRFLSLVQTK